VSKQPDQGISTRTHAEEGLVGVDQVAGIQVDIAATERGVKYCATEDQFWEVHMPSITVLGRTIDLDPETHPLPEVLADKILEDDTAYQHLLRFEQWIDTATPQQIADVVGRLRALTQ
jgi:hypothetical protein